MEFEWTILPGSTTLEILVKIQNMMDETRCIPEKFTGRILFMSMFNDMCGEISQNSVPILFGVRYGRNRIPSGKIISEIRIDGFADA